MLGFLKKLFSAEMYEVEPETTGEASLSVPTIEEPAPGGAETAAAGGESTSEKAPVRAVVLGRERGRQPVPPVKKDKLHNKF